MNPQQPAIAPPADGDRTLIQGPFHVVLNSGSGHRDSDETGAAISSVLSAAGRRFELLEVSVGAQLPVVAREAVARARRDGGVVVAAGGDGTLNTVCQALAGSGVPLGVVPLGTFNYFARNHGIPQDAKAAACCLLDARIQPVHAGFLNGHIFLVNASLGLYPRLLEEREAYKGRLGRSRLVALFSALATLGRAHRVLGVQVEVEGRSRYLRTVSMVVASNALQLEHIGVELADQLQQGQLAAMLVRPIGNLALYGLLLRGLLRSLGSAENLHSFPFTTMSVSRAHQRSIKVALDGEVCRMRLPLEFRAGPGALSLLVPRNPVLRERA
ncbi:MAG: diacylglycerol/lipid kinase family protein [Parahaliea sp.]